MRGHSYIGALAVLGLLGISPVWGAPDQPAGAQPQFAAKGARLFERYCSGCHGPEARGGGYRILGGDPANLRSRLTQEKADEDLLQTIHEGKPSMPAWKSQLSKDESRQVLDYIRSLVLEEK